MGVQAFSIGTALYGESRHACIIADERVWKLSDLPGFAHVHTTLALLDDWANLQPRLIAAMNSASINASLALDDVRLQAPVFARQIFCTGANYRKHVAELTAKQVDPANAHLTSEERIERVKTMMDDRARNGTPYAFVKLPSAITGPYDQIILPSGALEPDWELELAVVIGITARNVSRDAALSIVAGYMVANDITVRDRIYRADLKAIGTDWLASKCAETFLPTGPWITPACFVPDPQNLRITLKLNGQVMQDECTSDMIFDVARQIEYISSHVRLLPGDIICTGSPAGNGTHYQRFLQPDDVVEGSITGLGTQKLTCVAQAADGGAA